MRTLGLNSKTALDRCGFRWLVLQDVRFIDPVEKFCRTSVDPAHREVLKLSRAWIGGWFPFGLLLDRRYRLCWDALCSSSGLQIDNNMSFL
ncbi:hypothetical protein RIR_jg10769.t1 [Rhizophagus irregularis DAOM 181602=DAOM 197198]|nr:hypothetical protein RIR_jg10769.t1 [Rhizophagus irregularis DAOM 181602=DAOM 197198]